ncbi:hypothetical protein R3P38DRAFT_2786885 [Favolaschia claudopus]|uniref:Uncharacterized protein n=1 Tax=Favolaschia claudopus TaxID=2862362 RepID=A0AAW0AQM3_9AGAR
MARVRRDTGQKFGSTEYKRLHSSQCGRCFVDHFLGRVVMNYDPFMVDYSGTTRLTSAIRHLFWLSVGEMSSAAVQEFPLASKLTGLLPRNSKGRQEITFSSSTLKGYPSSDWQGQLNLEGTGVRPTYARGHVSESTMRSLRRKCAWTNAVTTQPFLTLNIATQNHSKLVKQDGKIEAQNKRIRTAHTSKLKAEAQLASLNWTAGSQMQLTKAQNVLVRANEKFEKALAASMEVVGSGSGKVGLLLPSGAARDFRRDNV